MNLLTGVNPVTRILGLILLSTPLLFTVDVVSAAVATASTLVAAPLCGVSYPRLFKRAWPLLLVAPIAGIPMALYGRSGGEVYVNFFLVEVSQLSLSLAVAVTVRVIAIALPVAVLSADVDPTDLGDGLSQVLKLPERFVIGSVAALRMLTLLRDDLSAMRRARRARGLADTGVRYWLTLMFGVLVMSLRRAGKLASAMEARGFGGNIQRTHARKSRLGRRDWVVMAICLCIGIAALALACATGHFRPVWDVTR